MPNVLERDFCGTAPNQKWATDATEFNLNGSKLYLSAYMDLYNGEIVAHQMARGPVYELVTTSTRVGVAEDIVISMVVFLFLSVRNTDGTVFQGVNAVRYYNHERIQLRLKGLSPVEYQLRITV